MSTLSALPCSTAVISAVMPNSSVCSRSVPIEISHRSIALRSFSMA
jgi:hypothetical protein